MEEKIIEKNIKQKSIMLKIIYENINWEKNCKWNIVYLIYF